MSDGRLSPFRNPWVTTSIALTLLIAVGAVFTGFVGLPLLQSEAQFQGVWNAICSAAGIVRGTPEAEPVVQATYQTTRVVVTPGMLEGAGAEAVGRGATFALRCTMCHGARGLSEAGSPNLAGQYASVIYKQLQDYTSGARSSAIMMPLVAGLTDNDMRDLAAYYAYLPRLPDNHPSSSGPAPQIVANGAPLRGIAPCGTCHGGLDHKAGSAWLDGQPSGYLRAQLRNFASGTRHNDISEQMRNIARRMTPAEIDDAARFYGHDR